MGCRSLRDVFFSFENPYFMEIFAWDILFNWRSRSANASINFSAGMCSFSSQVSQIIRKISHVLFWAEYNFATGPPRFD